jgi:hypothetical protein
MAKWLGLNGTMLGLIATQVLFQGIVAAALTMKARRVERELTLAQSSPAVAK